MLQLVNVTSAPSLMFTPPPYQQRKSVNTVMDKVGGGGLPSWTHILRTCCVRQHQNMSVLLAIHWGYGQIQGALTWAAVFS